MKKLRAVWQSLWTDVDRRVRLGRILGLVFVAGGFAVMGKAWDGASNLNFVTGQFPYLISGGFMGLGMVITGATLLLLSTVRAERQVLTDKFDEMATLLGRNLGRMQISSNGSSGSPAGSQEQVIAGADTYHLTDCRVLAGKKDLTTLTVDQAVAEDLRPCRACNPPEPAAKSNKSANGTEVIPVESGTPAR